MCVRMRACVFTALWALVGWFSFLRPGLSVVLPVLEAILRLSVEPQMGTWVNLFVNYVTEIMTNVFYPLLPIVLVMPKWRFHFITFFGDEVSYGLVITCVVAEIDLELLILLPLLLRCSYWCSTTPDLQSWG